MNVIILLNYTSYILITLYDAGCYDSTGESLSVAADHGNGNTVISYRIAVQGLLPQSTVT